MLYYHNIFGYLVEKHYGGLLSSTVEKSSIGTDKGPQIARCLRTPALASALRLACTLHTQRAQYPLKKEYALNHTRILSMIKAKFLNEGILGSLGVRVCSKLSACVPGFLVIACNPS